MDIKSVFEITKADRYTQDGRDQIAKIQETEDKTYQIGEISQKTGLQKTANGWVPPKETKYGKVTEKNGQVGVQQKLGKGSKFEAFKNESAAKRALANYTAGYNTTERSKQDPHSDQARLMKHLDKETEQMARENKKKPAAGSAWETQHGKARAAGYEMKRNGENGKMGGEYKVFMNGLDEVRYDENGYNEQAQGKQYSAMESGPGGRRRFFDTFEEADAFNKAAAGADPQLAKEIANGNHFEEQKKEAAKSKQEAELKQQRAEGEANAEAYRKRYEAEHGPNPGTATTPKPDVMEYMKAKDRIKAFEKQYEKEMRDYEYLERVRANGADTGIFNPMYGNKPMPLEKRGSYMEALNTIKAFEGANDSAPLTGDTRLRLSQITNK